MSRLIELLLICLFVVTQSLKDDTHQRPNLCALPREPGACKESINRWYFDSDDNVCKQFEYTGCAGNGNNFDTESLCQKTCPAGSVTTAPEQNCAQKRKALVTKGHLTDDTFVPNCTPDGSYSASQCNNNGQCFCVNPKTGEEISGTRTDSGHEPSFCEGSKKCPNEPPLTDIHGVDIYCGSGSNHQDCPDGYECNKHPGGLYAVCCKHEDSPTVVPKVVQHAGGEEPKTKQQAPLQDKREAQESSSHPNIGNLVDNPVGEIQKWGKCSTNNTAGYSPRCTSEGHYQWIQCENEKNNSCWCVDPETGEELIGTRKNELVSCVDCYSNGPLLSNFKPQCEIPLFAFKQTYTQCPSYVTTCGCMDINTGKDIEGSTVGPGDKFPSCTFMPTFRGSCNVTAMMEPEFRGPSCSVNGFFSPMQCEIKEGVGYSCFCVDPTNMAEIQGTRFYATGKQVECPKCLMSKYMALDYLSIGAFVPQCTETGEFNPLQCNNRTGVCFCVYTDGTIVPGTRKPIDNGLPHCQVANKSSVVFDQFASNPVRAPQNAETSTISESSKSGQRQGKCVSVPGSPTRCTQEGFYDFVQCDGHKDGYCWCVNPETNVEVEGTRKSENLTCLECLASGPLVINFLPRCDFTPKVLSKLNSNNLLCPTTAKSCGCLDVTTGATIPGHDVAGGQPMSSCEFLPAVKGPCNVNDSSDTADYKVQCTKNGFFVPVQCDQNTNCWCVDPENNKEIKGTRVKQPSVTPTCTKCLLAKAMAFEFFPFAFLPQCTENGDFVPLQCDNKTGSCFCVNVNGTIVPGTRQKAGSSKHPDCTETVTLSNAIEASIDDSSACLRELKTAQEKGHLKAGPHAMVVGGFIPRCTKAGTYEPLQCHGSTGICWCVTENGTEISGTRSGPGKTRPVCSRDEPNEEDDLPSPKSTDSTAPCKSVVKSLGENPPPGTFVPNCTESGFYHPMQCHQSTGYCWCVTEDGKEINGTRIAPGNLLPVCERQEPIVLTSSRTQLAKPAKPVKSAGGVCAEKLAVLGDNYPPGTLVPNCTETGNYRPLQCHPSTGHCWCVTENGTEIEGTRVGPGSVAPLCERNEPVNTLDLSNRGKPCKTEPAENSPPGSFVPRCTEAGFYEPLQCHGSTGQCWCATSEGNEIKGTRTLPGHGPPDCTSTASASASAAGLQAAVSNTSLGAEIEGNGPCRKKLNLLGDKIPIGAFIPQCKDNGDYHAKQCHGSTGFCWCVTSNGTEIPGTKKAAGNGTVSCTFEIDDVLVGPSIEQPPGETIKTSGSNPCNLPKDAGIYCDDGSNSTNPQTRWYFSIEKDTCLAFKYAGCAGNENNFQSTSDCDVRCRPQDGPTCNGHGNSRPYSTNVTMTGPALGPGHAPKRLHCDDVQCPNGFKCKMGWMSPACCNETVEKLFDEAYDPMCSNGRKAYSVKSESNFRSPFFGDSCKDLLCPKGYVCNQTNFMFAKCCPTADFVEDEEPKKEEIAVCPTGTPIKDFAAGGYRLCNAESSCPNSSFCWNVSHPHERNVQGVCCPSPKIPSTLRKVLEKQNCTLQTREHIQECLKPFENITKKFSSLSISSPANVGELFPENATIISLNHTCSKYQEYKLCTKDIYKPTYCYNHKSHMVDEILGFACKPETIEVFLKNKHCLEDIVKDDSVKQCVIQFAQTLRVLSEGGERRFGGLCSSIERFIECVKPSITSNCSSDIFGLMREFVNRTVDVVFGGTCQEVIDSERAELIHETLPDFGCTVEQTKSLTDCTQKFVETPVVAKNFPAQTEPASVLITKQQLDSLDSFCVAYKVYEVCAKPVILTDTKCKPFLYQALENMVGFNCKEDIVKQWKKHGPCLSKLTNRTEVIQCFEILANVQKGLNTSKGVDPPLDKLCAQTESHIKCMEKPVSDQCGKDTYQFYSLIYANSKRFLFSPCYQLQEDSSTQEQQEVEVPVNGTAEASIDTQTAAVPASGSPKSIHEEIVSSAVTIVTKLVTVASTNSTVDQRACILRRDSMLWASTIPTGQYIPQCKDNGDYKPIQCDPAKGTCWCVNEITGEEIQGTLVHSSDNKTASCGPCHKARADALVHSSSTKFVPVCQENGKYHHLQCSIETGDCWCVDVENGTEVAGSKVGPGKKLPTCGVKEVYACTRLALKSSCMPDSSKPQEVFRWYRDGDKCKIYRFNYCEMEAHVPPYPLKEQKDCERLCIGKQSDFVPVST